jgi:hypothetical protein
MDWYTILAVMGGILLGVILGHMFRNADDQRVIKIQYKTIIHLRKAILALEETIDNQNAILVDEAEIIDVQTTMLQSRDQWITKARELIEEGGEPIE